MKKDVKSISELIAFVSQIESKNILVFRGEKRNFPDGALVPLVYRDKYIEKEDVIYRESQRFNDDSFNGDKTTFDRLSRIQHYSAPTRLIDVSEDLFSALFFAIAEKKDYKNDALIYVLEIDDKKVKFYDSDSVSVVSNLVKIPLNGDGNKSKICIAAAYNLFKNDKSAFNQQGCIDYLLHEIRDEKPQFLPIINPKHIYSIQFVLPKFTSNRLRSQKGAFLLFGLNPEAPEKSIKLIENGELSNNLGNVDHPIITIHTAVLKADKIKKMQDDLEKFGIRKSFIYPEIDKVSEYLKAKYK
jgi:hypothetical protein